MPSLDADLALLPRVHVAMGETEVRLAAALAISPREAGILGYLTWSPPPVAGRDIRQRFGLSAAGTTELIDRLERLGHVRRSRWPEDTRVVHLSVTSETVALIETHLRSLLRDTARLLESFDASERDAIRRFLVGAIGVSEKFRPD